MDGDCPPFGIARKCSPVRAKLREERGFTLIEVMITCLLLTVVLGALLGILDTTSAVSARDQERPLAIREGQVGLYRMTRELRQATQVFSVTSQRAEVQATIGGQPQRILYACDVTPSGATYRRCVRSSSTDLTQPLSPGSTVVVDRVLNGTSADPGGAVFTLTSASYASARLVVAENPQQPLASAHKMVFTDGFYMRNLGKQ